MWSPIETVVDAIEKLSMARSLANVVDIVRVAARQTTGADGATFVLKDGDQCYYVDEDAIAPLWKGRRFPLEACISGWVMVHRQPVVVDDIYRDERIPATAYRPTFVRSLAMVPIRARAPLGAIGNYWATNHTASAHELRLLQALANATAVAIECAVSRGDAAVEQEPLLNMCSHCRRVRAGAEQWLDLEEFLVRHTDKRFTHGICPSCLELHFPDL